MRCPDGCRRGPGGSADTRNRSRNEQGKPRPGNAPASRPRLTPEQADQSSGRCGARTAYRCNWRALRQSSDGVRRHGARPPVGGSEPAGTRPSRSEDHGHDEARGPELAVFQEVFKTGSRKRSTYQPAGPDPRRAHRGADECGRWPPARRSRPQESAAGNGEPRKSSGSANKDLPEFAGRGVSNRAWASLWRCALRCRCSNPAKAAKLAIVKSAARHRRSVPRLLCKRR